MADIDVYNQTGADITVNGGTIYIKSGEKEIEGYVASVIKPELQTSVTQAQISATTAQNYALQVSQTLDEVTNITSGESVLRQASDEALEASINQISETLSAGIPHKTSELTNDSGFLTASSIDAGLANCGIFQMYDFKDTEYKITQANWVERGCYVNVSEYSGFVNSVKSLYEGGTDKIKYNYEEYGIFPREQLIKNNTTYSGFDAYRYLTSTTEVDLSQDSWEIEFPHNYVNDYARIVISSLGDYPLAIYDAYNNVEYEVRSSSDSSVYDGKSGFCDLENYNYGKLVRNANTFTLYKSTDGVTWELSKTSTFTTNMSKGKLTVGGSPYTYAGAGFMNKVANYYPNSIDVSKIKITVGGSLQNIEWQEDIIYNGFSTTNKLLTPYNPKLSLDKSWELFVDCVTGDTSNVAHLMYSEGYYSSFKIHRDFKPIKLDITYADYTSVTISAGDIENNTPCLVRVRYFPETTTVEEYEYTGQSVYLEVSTDKGTTWSRNSVALTKAIYYGSDDRLYFNENASTYVWQGFINLSKTYCKINGEYTWKATCDYKEAQNGLYIADITEKSVLDNCYNHIAENVFYIINGNNGVYLPYAKTIARYKYYRMI